MNKTHMTDEFRIENDGTITQLIKLEETNWGPIIHEEPDCRGYNRCRQLEPHKHGYACDKTCIECWGYCHLDCPANKNLKEENPDDGTVGRE